jgi:hypothetical protein
MSVSLAERAVEAIAVLVEAVRLGLGWSVDAGAQVRRSPVFVDLTDDLYWESLVYEAREEITGYAGGPVVAATSMVSVKLYVNVDVFTAADPGREARQHQRIKADLRKALSPPIGRLADSDGVIGTLEHLGAELITEKLAAGVIGVRTQTIVHYIEAWGNPTRAP